MITLLSKFGIPFLLMVIAFGAGYYTSEKLQKPVDYDRIRKSVAEEIAKIPQPKPQGSSIDIDKLKGFKGTFAVHQHTHIEANGDSLILEKIQDEMKKLKLSRCK